MARPGVVLRRPVGSNGAFGEHVELPKHLPIDKVNELPARQKTKAPGAHKDEEEVAKDAALAFEREQNGRESARRKEEAARERKRKRREQARAKAESALEEAKRHHDAEVEEIEKDHAALDRRVKAEDARWKKQNEKLMTALRRVED